MKEDFLDISYDYLEECVNAIKNLLKNNYPNLEYYFTKDITTNRIKLFIQNKVFNLVPETIEVNSYGYRFSYTTYRITTNVGDTLKILKSKENNGQNKV